MHETNPHCQLSASHISSQSLFDLTVKQQENCMHCIIWGQWERCWYHQPPVLMCSLKFIESNYIIILITCMNLKDISPQNCILQKENEWCLFALWLFFSLCITVISIRGEIWLNVTEIMSQCKNPHSSKKRAHLLYAKYNFRIFSFNFWDYIYPYSIFKL